MDDPDNARQLVRDLRLGMEEVAFSNHRQRHRSTPDDMSPQKKEWGDSWSLVYGITTGISLMRQGKEVQHDFETGEMEDLGVTDKYWREHYEEFGYGDHGVGLELGKRLAFYSGKEFNFSQSSNDSEDSFTFVNPDENDSEFTFTQ